MYAKQLDRGAYFLHEHPAGATSWKQACIQRLLARDGVDRVVADQCQHGQEIEDGDPLKKPTGFLSNSAEILRVLERRCKGRKGLCSREAGGRHALCNGKVARRAAIFHAKMCEAILEGMRSQCVADGLLKNGEVGLGVHMLDGDDELAACNLLLEDKPDNARDNCKPAEHVITPDRRPFEDLDPSSKRSKIITSSEYGHSFAVSNGRNERFVDDLTGQPLPPDLCREARRVEIQYFRDKGVWDLKPIREALARTGRRPISVRWVEVNKGDSENPKIRSRLVAREIRGPGQEPCFAPTPPLESLRMVLSYAVTDIAGQKPKTWSPTSPQRMQMSLIDISRAYFNAPTDPLKPSYVELPAEAGAPSGTCALLKRHMYGTQKAADGWQSEYSGALIEMGFTQGTASACVFSHIERGIVLSVHGDDFTAAGPKDSLDWYQKQMQERYELTIGGRLGPGDQDDKEATILNRVVRWTARGLEYEADPRQAERLLHELKLDDKTNGSTTPGVKVAAHQAQDEKPLPEREFTEFRGHSARANYLSADRPDIIFAAKEVCRFMSKLTDVAQCALKRMARYLRARPRLVWEYPYQQADRLEVYTDTDYAGCVRTRKSTSGGCLMMGSHVLKCWSTTQAVVALSSGEAEFYGVVKGSAVGLGQRALLRDIGIDIPLRVWTDSSAAIGICGRQGIGKVRHLACHTLWVQQRVRRGDFELRKVKGEDNPADLFTKHMESRDKLNRLVSLYNCSFREGRAAAAPALRREAVAANVDYEDLEESMPSADPTLLPHQIPPAELDDYFPRAPVVEAALGEPDVEQDDALDDPDPALTIPRATARKVLCDASWKQCA